MNVDLARTPFPRSRRDEEGDDNAGYPLEKHQPREEMVRLAENLSPVLLEKLFTPVAHRFRHRAQGG
jgi:hypothetical protein